MTTAAADEPVLSTDETIRQTVRALRSARQADALVVAQAIGVSRQSFYNRLNGAAPFLAAEVAALAAFFAVPITDFYEGIVRVGPPARTGARTGGYKSPCPGPSRPLALVPALQRPYSDGSAGILSSALGQPSDLDVKHSSREVNHANAA